jgi:DNA-binding NarL/FixJ family response regulator
MPATMPRILIADDNEYVRISLRMLLSGHDGWDICGEAANGREAVSLAQTLHPDLVVLDVAMPVLDGLQAAGQILDSNDEVPVVLFTLHKDSSIDRVAKRIGVRNVVSKADDSRVLIRCLENLLHEPHFDSPSIVTQVNNN